VSLFDDQHTTDVYVYAMASDLAKCLMDQALLQKIVDRINNRHLVIVSSRRVGKSAVMAETAKQVAAKTDESASKGKSGGGVVAPCPWGKESGPETFTAVTEPGEIKRLPDNRQVGRTTKMLLLAKEIWENTNRPIVFVAPTYAMAEDIERRFCELIGTQAYFGGRVRTVSLKEARSWDVCRRLFAVAFFLDHTCYESHSGLADMRNNFLRFTNYRGQIMTDFKGELLAGVSAVKSSIDLKPRSVVDKLRIADILVAMSASNAIDKAIPEEWMDELSDLVWRERDRLEGSNA